MISHVDREPRASVCKSKKIRLEASSLISRKVYSDLDRDFVVVSLYIHVRGESIRKKQKKQWERESSRCGRARGPEWYFFTRHISHVAIRISGNVTLRTFEVHYCNRQNELAVLRVKSLRRAKSTAHREIPIVSNFVLSRVEVSGWWWWWWDDGSGGHESRIFRSSFAHGNMQLATPKQIPRIRTQSSHSCEVTVRPGRRGICEKGLWRTSASCARRKTLCYFVRCVTTSEHATTYAICTSPSVGTYALPRIVHNFVPWASVCSRFNFDFGASDDYDGKSNRVSVSRALVTYVYFEGGGKGHALRADSFIIGSRRIDTRVCIRENDDDDDDVIDDRSDFW